MWQKSVLKHEFLSPVCISKQSFKTRSVTWYVMFSSVMMAGVYEEDVALAAAAYVVICGRYRSKRRYWVRPSLKARAKRNPFTTSTNFRNYHPKPEVTSILFSFPTIGLRRDCSNFRCTTFFYLNSRMIKLNQY